MAFRLSQGNELDLPRQIHAVAEVVGSFMTEEAGLAVTTTTGDTTTSRKVAYSFVVAGVLARADDATTTLQSRFCQLTAVCLCRLNCQRPASSSY